MHNLIGNAPGVRFPGRFSQEKVTNTTLIGKQGLAKSPKRGHHKNVKIHNPQDWSLDSYLRDDVRIDSKEYLSEVLKDYKLCPEDIDKIWAIINKKDSH